MKTKKTLKIGTSDFNRILTDNGYFVDKTMLIKEFYENSSYVSLMPRPKRFGKTLNLSMIEHFFDIQKPESKELFAEFEIAKYLEFCEEHQNKYPVINITLKDIKEDSWERCYNKFKKEISDLYKKYRFLLDSEKLESDEKRIIETIINREAEDIDYNSSLKDLSFYLKQHFNKEVIILVDEYDTPIIAAYKYTKRPIKRPKGDDLSYYQNVINFMQSFLGDAFKGNNSLKKGLITGVMRVGKESIFSDWNNFDVFSITMPYFSDSFGFTQHETEDILSYFGLQEKINDIKKWYNGYKFGDVSNIYNPWSIVNYISKAKAGFKPYWVNTSDDSLIKERITEPNIKEAIIDLINDKTITRTIKENFVFPDFESDPELLWTLMFHSGFLTFTKEVSLYRYELKIPNFELTYVFKNLILEWIRASYKFSQDLLITTSNHLINNRISEFETGFKRIIGDTLSYFDISERSEHSEERQRKEQFYHVYTLGLLAILSDDYMIKSNRESGEGRYDIVLIPHNCENNGIVIEIKSIDKQKENEKSEDFKTRINNEIDGALEQIERKKYYTELIEHKIELAKIVRIPIVFAGKEPYITKLTE